MTDPAAQSSDVLRSAKALFNNGEFFRSYDIARDGLERWPAELKFAHLVVLSLANVGAVEKALEVFTELGLQEDEGLEARALLARLNKDMGFASRGEERQAYHTASGAIYEELYLGAMERQDYDHAYYPGINAAALATWSGDREGAVRLASEVLTLLEALEQPSSPDENYWRLATRAEACLILGDLDQVERTVSALRLPGAGKSAQTATTERQLRRLAESLELPLGFLRQLTLPGVMHYTGHIMAGPGRSGRLLPEEETSVRERVDALLTAQDVGSGYGSLAAGADILFAEALLARGASLHVVLPFALEDFLASSVAPSGSGWVERFHRCLAEANSVRYATEDRFLQHDSLFQYCAQLAMGLALLAARHLQAPAMQCAVWDGGAGHARAGTTVDMQMWQTTQLPQHIVRCGTSETEIDLPATHPGATAPFEAGRKIRAMLFGDLHGFSKLTDLELPRFAEHVMGPVATVVRMFRKQTLFVNTWGDGIFCVFERVCEAANWALTMQESMRDLDLEAAGLPLDLHLRLGGHLGPVYELMDPVLERLNFYGSHVSRAARIEPVTPEGCVYVTETFAAVLALEDCHHFACDYAGYTEMAKSYGRLRIFLLRRVTGDAGPVVLGDIERPPL